MKKKFTARAAVKIFKEVLKEIGVEESVGIGWRDKEGKSHDIVILGQEEARRKIGCDICAGYVSIEESILYNSLNFFGGERTSDGRYVVDILINKFDEYDAHYEMKNTCELTIWRD
jgi:hypothetical protein